jgi:hypothetical protein
VFFEPGGGLGIGSGVGYVVDEGDMVEVVGYEVVVIVE